jgi:uncharacterized protein (TIGR02266 family)
MAQDTRKDPRAKVLSMTVRYKSATVDEFIEHHSHDVSRGGIFIKTPSPFPPGTLLKFEIRIQDEQSVLAGVGRVVWKREPAEAGGETPAGMGVKFIKIDDKSKGLISRLVDAQGGGQSAFDAGKPTNGSEPAAPVAAAPAAKKEEPKAQPKRASTMLGLGSIGGPKKGAAAEPAKDEAKDAAFFPKTNPEKEMPPPEERTVMKQAAELLKQALAEAGGSMEDIGTAKEKPAEEKKPVEAPATKVEAAAEPAEAKKPISEPPPKVKSEPPPAAKPKVDERPKVRAEPVAAKSVSKPPLAPPEESGGSGRVLMILLALAAIGGGAWFLLGRNNGGDTTAPTSTASAAPSGTASAAPSAQETAAPPASAEPTQAASAEPEPPATASAAPSAAESATAKAPKVRTPPPPPPPREPPPPKEPPAVKEPPPASTGAPAPKPPPPAPKPKKSDDPYG